MLKMRQSTISPNSRNRALNPTDPQKQNQRWALDGQSISSGNIKRNERLLFMSKQLDEAQKIDKRRKRILRQAETLDDSEKDAFTFFFSNKSPSKLVESVQELSPDRVAYKNDKKQRDKKLEQQRKQKPKGLFRSNSIAVSFRQDTSLGGLDDLLLKGPNDKPLSQIDQSEQEEQEDKIVSLASSINERESAHKSDSKKETPVKQASTFQGSQDYGTFDSNEKQRQSQDSMIKLEPKMIQSAEQAIEIRLNVGQSLQEMPQLVNDNKSPAIQSAQQTPAQRRISQRRNSHIVTANQIKILPETPTKPSELKKDGGSEKSSSSQSLTKTNKRSSSASDKSSKSSDEASAKKIAENNAEIERQIDLRIKKWKESEAYQTLPQNARIAVENRMRRQKHSDFYYKLKELTERLYLFTAEANGRVPVFEQAYRRKQAEERRRTVNKMLRKQRRQQRELREQDSTYMSPSQKQTRSLSPGFKRETSVSNYTRASVSQLGGISKRDFSLKRPSIQRQPLKSPTSIQIKPKAAIKANLQKATKADYDPRNIIEQVQDKVSVPSTMKIKDKNSENTKNDSPSSSFKVSSARASLPQPQIQISKKITILGDGSSTGKESGTPNKVQKKDYFSKKQRKMGEIMQDVVTAPTRQGQDQAGKIALPKLMANSGNSSTRHINLTINRLKGKQQQYQTTVHALTTRGASSMTRLPESSTSNHTDRESNLLPNIEKKKQTILTERKIASSPAVHTTVIEEKIRNGVKKRTRIIKAKSVKRLPQEIVQYVDVYCRPFPKLDSQQGSPKSQYGLATTRNKSPVNSRNGSLQQSKNQETPSSYQTILEAIKRERRSLLQTKRGKPQVEQEQREDLSKKFNLLQIGHGTGLTKQASGFMHIRTSQTSKREKTKPETKKKVVKVQSQQRSKSPKMRQSASTNSIFRREYETLRESENPYLDLRLEEQLESEKHNTRYEDPSQIDIQVDIKKPVKIISRNKVRQPEKRNTSFI